jgi:hypothetical protein
VNGRRRRGRGPGALALVLLLLALASRPAAAGETTAGEDHVRWASGLDRVGRDAAEALPLARRHVDERLRLGEGRRPVEVVVVTGLDAMREETRAGVPEWAVGVAQWQRGKVVVRADLLEQGFGGGLLPTLRHELVHVAWGRRAGMRQRDLPLWVEEGVAEEIGGGISVDVGAALDLAVLRGSLLDFDRLATSFPADAREADLAYKQSRSWVRHLVERRGWDALRDVLIDVADARVSPEGPGDTTFAAAVRLRSGRGVAEWHAEWQRAVTEASRPWFHLLFSDLGGLLLTVAAAAAAVVYFFLRARRRRQIEALEVGPDVEADAERTE